MEPATLDHAVETLLNGLELNKYIPQFEKNMVSMQLFMTLTEDDLVAIGVDDPTDLDLILKYIKKFQRSHKNIDIDPLRQEDVELSLKNVANHLFAIDVGMSYVHENITEEEPIDFIIDKVPASSGIGILCDRVEHECSNFIAEIDQLIRVLENPRKKTSNKLLTTGISLTVLASALITAFFFRSKNVI